MQPVINIETQNLKWIELKIRSEITHLKKVTFSDHQIRLQKPLLSVAKHIRDLNGHQIKMEAKILVAKHLVTEL